jgi:hypothetical protein
MACLYRQRSERAVVIINTSLPSPSARVLGLYSGDSCSFLPIRTCSGFLRPTPAREEEQGEGDPLDGRIKVSWHRRLECLISEEVAVNFSPDIRIAQRFREDPDIFLDFAFSATSVEASHARWFFEGCYHGIPSGE